MPRQVYPGGVVNVSVPMAAPQEPGEYESHWVLRDAEGRTFGVGEGGDETFWTIIVVEDAGQQDEEEQQAEGEEQDEEVMSVETTLEIDPADYTGACPASFTVYFSITTEGTDHYTYELVSGATQAGFEITLPEAKEVTIDGGGKYTKTVEYTLNMYNSVEGWLQILVTDPGDYSSGKVYFTVNCE